MMRPSSLFAILAIAGAAPSAATDLSWGTFLGANWRTGEANLRTNLAISIKNTQKGCGSDVEKLCLPSGNYANAFGHAATDWTNHYVRHMYTQFEEMPIGYGEAADACLHKEYIESETGTAKRLSPRCVTGMESTEDRFNRLASNEKGNDKREWFIRFATLIAALLSVGTGVIYGIFKAERDESLSLGFGSQDDKVITVFLLACTIPAVIILWASPVLMTIMFLSFLVGRFSQLFFMKMSENQYSSVSTMESGLVFAAIPVQLD